MNNVKNQLWATRGGESSLKSWHSIMMTERIPGTQMFMSKRSVGEGQLFRMLGQIFARTVGKSARSLSKTDDHEGTPKRALCFVDVRRSEAVRLYVSWCERDLLEPGDKAWQI